MCDGNLVSVEVSVATEVIPLWIIVLGLASSQDLSKLSMINKQYYTVVTFGAKSRLVAMMTGL